MSEEISPETIRFIQQNPVSALDLRVSEVEKYAEHHAGGLVVLGSFSIREGFYVKMHDSWSDNDEVVVHEYNPDEPSDEDEETYFDNGVDAFAFFETRVR